MAKSTSAATKKNSQQTKGNRNKDKANKATKAKNKAKVADDELNSAILAERTTRAEELAKLPKDEVKQLYFTTFGVEPDAELTVEQAIEAINDELTPPPAPASTYSEEEDEDFEEVFGNKDTDQLFPIPTGLRRAKDEDGNEQWKEKVVVYQVPTRVLEGNSVDLKNQGIIQAYAPKIWKLRLKEKYFAESKIRVTILHEPDAE